MTCAELQNWIDGYIDGEIDLVRSLEIERHLETCSSCMARVKERRALQAHIQSANLTYKAPDEIYALVKKPLSVPVVETIARRWFDSVSWRSFATVGCALVFCGVLGGVLFHNDRREEFADTIVSAHIRSLMVAHLMDVASTDQHTVKPWFNGKLDYSPAVRDFADRGFPLIGGRLDYLSNRVVAAVVYRRAAHPINLFVWPTSLDDHSGEREEAIRGYHVIHWSSAGMTYWVVSDLNENELKDFAELVQR